VPPRPLITGIVPVARPRIMLDPEPIALTCRTADNDIASTSPPATAIARGALEKGLKLAKERRKNPILPVHRFFAHLTNLGYVVTHKEPNIIGGSGRDVEYSFLRLGNGFFWQTGEEEEEEGEEEGEEGSDGNSGYDIRDVLLV
jgi:hypothetical protein